MLLVENLLQNSNANNSEQAQSIPYNSTVSLSVLNSSIALCILIGFIIIIIFIASVINPDLINGLSNRQRVDRLPLPRKPCFIRGHVHFNLQYFDMEQQKIIDSNHTVVFSLVSDQFNLGLLRIFSYSYSRIIFMNQNGFPSFGIILKRGAYSLGPNSNSLRVTVNTGHINQLILARTLFDSGRIVQGNFTPRTYHHQESLHVEQTS